VKDKVVEFDPLALRTAIDYSHLSEEEFFQKFGRCDLCNLYTLPWMMYNIEVTVEIETMTASKELSICTTCKVVLEAKHEVKEMLLKDD